jgi:hypothetical protein
MLILWAIPKLSIQIREGDVRCTNAGLIGGHTFHGDNPFLLGKESRFDWRIGEPEPNDHGEESSDGTEDQELHAA